MDTVVGLNVSGEHASKRVLCREQIYTPEPPLVSIIIPCYNGETFLREAIESALAQSYSRVEVIVVDDGSTDKSADIAHAYPIRYLHQSNAGLTASRNLGIRVSTGSYIVFLDADDRLMPDAIAIGLAVLMDRPECAMAIGDHLFVSAEGAFLANSRKTCLFSEHYEALLKSNFIEMISTVVFRREVFDHAGGFDTELRVAEDYELYLRIARNHAVCCHDAVVAEYRMHKTNASHNSELMLTMTLQVLQSQRRFLLNHPRRLFAFLEGNRQWRRQYGRQLAAELAGTFSGLQMEALGRKLLVLANHYPQGLAVLVLLRMMPSLRQHKANSGRRGGPAERPLLEKLHAWLNAYKPHASAQIG